MNRVIFIVIIFVLQVFFIDTAYAARSLSITSNKTTLFGDEEMSITASVSGFTNGETIYIKGAFYQDGSTNYFGYTKNLDNWIKNGDTSLNQRQVKIGDWDGNVLIESDFGDSGYKGEGGYKFKLGFYYITNNSTGNLSSINWSSNNLDINLNEPDPTATPIPTKKPTPTNTPIPTNEPTSFKMPTPKITLIPTKKPMTIPNNLSSAGGSLKDVLGTQSARVSSVSSKQKKNKVNENKSQNWLIYILISAGGLLLIGCGILIYWRRRVNETTSRHQ